MTPADKRMMELLDKWLTSLELHLKYVDLNEAEYAAVQPWPKHDRPTRWIIELARQKTLELKTQQESRIAMGDGKFAEALELMGFLANLVGSQHVQRFIPIAEPEKEKALPQGAKGGAAASSGRPTPTSSVADERKRDPADTAATREMPRIPATLTPPDRKPAEPPPQPRKEARAAPKPAKKSAAAAAPAKPAVTPALEKKVMADAVRLLKWGKEWHELVDLIDRIADRPGSADIRKILRAHKAEIVMQAEADE